VIHFVPMRSGTSARRSRGISASKLPVMPYGLGRVRRPSSRTSRNPAVVISPQRAPVRSSTALVATVVPWTSAATVARSFYEARGFRAIRFTECGQGRADARCPISVGTSGATVTTIRLLSACVGPCGTL
jgi:hypothetical protein